MKTPPFSLGILIPMWLTLHLTLALLISVVMKHAWGLFSYQVGLHDITYSAAFGMYGFAVCLSVAFRSTSSTKRDKDKKEEE